MSKELNETEASLRLTENLMQAYDSLVVILRRYAKGQGWKETALEGRIAAFRDHYIPHLRKLAEGAPYEEVLNPEVGEGIFYWLVREGEVGCLPSLPPPMWELIANAMETNCNSYIEGSYRTQSDTELKEFLVSVTTKAAEEAVTTLELVED